MSRAQFTSFARGGAPLPLAPLQPAPVAREAPAADSSQAAADSSGDDDAAAGSDEEDAEVVYVKTNVLARHNAMAVSAASVGRVLASDAVTQPQRSALLAAFFSRAGHTLHTDPESSLVYYANALPPMRVLQQRAALPLRLLGEGGGEAMANGMRLRLWDARDFPQFAALAGRRLALEPDDVLLFCRGGATPLSVFLTEGEERRFAWGEARLSALVARTSCSQEAPSERSSRRRTGCVVLRDVRQTS